MQRCSDGEEGAATGMLQVLVMEKSKQLLGDSHPDTLRSIEIQGHWGDGAGDGDGNE